MGIADQKQMKAAIYNPYLDTLGGGERYTMAVATTLSKLGYEVEVEWKDLTIRKKLEDRFGIDLSKINFVGDVKRGDGYDVCFWVSDGSIPALKSRNNLLHFQVPFTNVNGRTLLNKIKLARIKRVVCNSRFTKRVIDKEFGVDSVVLYPPVAVNQFRAKRKEDSIIYVGRFSDLTQSKRHDILIKSFKKLFDNGFEDWRLILAGGVEVGATDYLKKLKTMSVGYPIVFLESPKFGNLRDELSKAKIFWSAGGYGINEKSNPRKVEHFGITVVEAMASGCIPIVYKAGGHKEIVDDGKNGYLWTKVSDLVSKTRKLNQNKKQLRDLASQAKKDAQKYSYESFEKNLKKLYE